MNHLHPLQYAEFYVKKIPIDFSHMVNIPASLCVLSQQCEIRKIDTDWKEWYDDNAREYYSSEYKVISRHAFPYSTGECNKFFVCCCIRSGARDLTDEIFHLRKIIACTASNTFPPVEFFNLSTVIFFFLILYSLRMNGLFPRPVVHFKSFSFVKFLTIWSSRTRCTKSATI